VGIKETEDAIEALEWARRKQAAALPIGVLGFSMGAVVACHVAQRTSWVRAVVTDSIYSRLFPVIKRSLWRGYHLSAFPCAWLTWWALQIALGKRLRRFDPAAVASELHQPLLAIQGGADSQITSKAGDEFFQRWAGPKERWFDPNVAHVGMFEQNPQGYATRIADFFDRTLS
jgi:pimeloyl-ACP methyl ester carboxylesterase